MRESVNPPRRDPARGSLLAPRHWAAWFGFGVVYLLVLLPFRVQMAIGRGLGRLAARLARREWRVGQINLRLCFPEMPQPERDRLLRRHFEALGCALFDTGLAWWISRERALKLTEVEGLEHLENALKAGRGAILFAAHFTTAEMSARALSIRRPIAAMYQRPRNEVIAEQFCSCSAAQSMQLIASDNVRELLRALKANVPVWFAADQREDMRSCTLAPFFGIPVISNTAPSRIARISGAPVLPYFMERVDGIGYRGRIGAALEAFPTQDEVADAARLLAVVEAEVRRCPEQYLWTYKRFKRPGADGDPYRR